jgi:antitoxin component of MazEF toxin-antitoxin module
MAEVEARARKWGDSLAVIIPSDIAKAENIRVNDRIHISVKKEYDLSPIFGIWKTKKTAQELKDEARKGWE